MGVENQPSQNPKSATQALFFIFNISLKLLITKVRANNF